MKCNNAIVKDKIWILMTVLGQFLIPEPANTTQPDNTDGHLAQAFETDRGDRRVSLKNKVAKEEIGSKKAVMQQEYGMRR